MLEPLNGSGAIEVWTTFSHLVTLELLRHFFLMLLRVGLGAIKVAGQLGVCAEDGGLPEVAQLVSEEIRVALELNDYGIQRRRIAFMRFLEELYNYELVDSSFIFCTHYLVLTFSRETDEVNLDSRKLELRSRPTIDMMIPMNVFEGPTKEHHGREIEGGSGEDTTDEGSGGAKDVEVKVLVKHGNKQQTKQMYIPQDR